MKRYTIMNTERIRIGMEVTYVELCELLGIEVGSNRKQQIISIKRYIDIEKLDCHRYKITGIHPIEHIYKTDIDRRMSRAKKNKELNKNYSFYVRKGDKYIRDSMYILLHTIANNKNCYIGSNEEINEILGIKRKDVDDIKGDGYIGFDNVYYHYKMTANRILHQNILTALVERKKLIKIENVIVYQDLGDKTQDNLKVANEVQTKIFSESINIVLKNNNLRNYSELFFNRFGGYKRKTKALDELQEILRLKLGWTKFIRKYKLSINPEVLRSKELLQIKETDIEEYRLRLNREFIDAFRNYMKNRGMEYTGYSPVLEENTIIGEYSKAAKDNYEEYCRNLEKIIKKYLEL